MWRAGGESETRRQAESSTLTGWQPAVSGIWEEGVMVTDMRVFRGLTTDGTMGATPGASWRRMCLVLDTATLRPGKARGAVKRTGGRPCNRGA